MIWGIIESGLHPIVALEVAGERGSDTLLLLVDTGFDVDLA